METSRAFLTVPRSYEKERQKFLTNPIAALRHFNCGHDLICLSSMLDVLNSAAIFSLIPSTFKSPDGDFMTLLNIMNKVLLVKQSIPSHQFNIDRICEAADLTKIRHIISPALRRYISLEKSF
ncbi:unnamed protein product, partial [Rotaria sp. Silwood1]